MEDDEQEENFEFDDCDNIGSRLISGSPTNSDRTADTTMASLYAKTETGHDMANMNRTTITGCTGE